jgi:hypothetical protein
MVLSTLEHLECPTIHVRQLGRKTYNENLRQKNSLFLLLCFITDTLEKSRSNLIGPIGLFHFKVEDSIGLSGRF